ncbi:hypothetical protein N864_01375 [Intrasporangium chromatireducens Q5-1]|uniref:DUF559 domain-containing protein n=1 Tax=Intrasporangium chromatireducens Q5-1 TaxID=584657 RepID=W9GI80_9MICO|nr:hypothetical protein [Intrasporangium chromatireducens]EWT05951.1 hypothetical protein N864_01375 [Intrasporangium chromatireducens Q5-1]
MPAEPSGPFRVVRDSKGAITEPAGLTDWDLRSGRFRRLFHGVYVSSRTVLRPRLLARAALLLAGEGAVVSHHDAARLWGGVVPEDPNTHVTCVGSRPQVRGIRAHRAKRGQRWAWHEGLPVMTPVTTFLDLAEVLDLVDLVVLGDSLIRAGRVTPQQLGDAARRHSGKGCRLARRAAGLVRDDVDSAMESRLRMLLVLAGLPEPTINHKIYWVDGRVRWRFDLSYPEFRLIIEYDGRQHRDSDDQWSIDIGRREWMDRNDWRIVVVIAKGVYRTPAATLQRVVDAMPDCGMVVPRLSDEWRRYFPSLSDDIAEPA